jgi:eukaryotic-like serine/threonine-protein kinase
VGTVEGVPSVSATRITLPDRYRVVRHLANGGMASVWEAQDELLGRAVAVKVLASHLSEDERARLRFQREARAVAGLSSHPHVVTIYDVGEHDGRSFIVMELLGGGSVADRIRGGRRVSVAETLQWLSEAGQALDAAHDAEIVHRDVKPGNMLLDERGRLALADFGIARVAWEDQLTQTGQVLGTAAYIAPEQAMGDPATPASDRYCLGVVAFELLTGRRPFEAEHFAAQARAHVEDDPPAASEIDNDLPRAVDDVLWRALAKRPEERWPTCGAFVEALEGALAPRRRAAAPTTAAMKPLAPRTRRAGAPPPRRGPDGATAAPAPRRGFGAAALAALAALLLLAVGAIVLLSGGGGGDGDRGSATPTPTASPRAERTAKPKASATATPTPTASATPTPTPTPTPTATAAPTQQASSSVPGNDPAALQRRAFELNNAGQPAQALPYAQKAVELCKGSDKVSPCAYALFEYAKALRLTGNPQAAIDVLHERQQRFPNDQPKVVDKELKAAEKAAKKGD